MGTGCAGDPDGPSGAADVGEVAEPSALAPSATERLIPIRVISCTSSSTDPDNIALGFLQQSVSEANQVFKSAGVQFYVKKIERYVMPTFAYLDERILPTWSSIRDQLKLSFPNLNTSTWSDTAQKNEFQWIDFATTLWGAEHELVYWVHKDVHGADGSQFHYGIFPDTGKAAVHMIGSTSVPLGPYKAAHELGHTLGLEHTFVYPPGLRDPTDLSSRTASDVWDLIYTAGSPNVFYSSAAQVDSAARAGKSFARIDQNGNCTVTDTLGSVQCTNVNGQTYRTGDDALKGLGFVFRSTHGPNIMSYTGGLGDAYARGLSDSQVALVQNTLRFEMPLVQSIVTAMTLPAGSSFDLTSARPDLATWEARDSVAYPLDFDGDKRRELAVWQAPTSLGSTGTFKILTSRSGHSTLWNVGFGLLGDVPFAQDYNGDGCTDIGVWRTSGPNADNPADNNSRFVYCPSTGAPNCAAPTSCGAGVSVTFGFRNDVAIARPKFSGVPGEIAIYRPATGEFYWRSYVAGGSNGGFPTPYSHYGFGSSTEGFVPMSGDYDWDGKMDPTLYAPWAGAFVVLGSKSAYSGKTYWFPGSVIPVDTTLTSPGSATDRAGAIPLGVTFGSSGILGLYSVRGGTNDGATWNEIYDTGTQTVVTCQYGRDGYFPVTGIDVNNDWLEDMVLFGTSADSGSVVYKLMISDCSGATGTLAADSRWKSPGMRVLGVSDMTGDGRNELMLIDPRFMWFYWLSSESGYRTVSSRGLGDQMSIPL